MDKINRDHPKRLDRSPWYKRIGMNEYMISPYYFILITLILIPMVIILFYSLLTTRSNYVLSTQFTFNYYAEFFRDSSYTMQLIRSIYFAGIATVICLIIGYPVAYIIAQQKKSTQALLIVLITCTMWINMIIRVYALESIFRRIYVLMPFLRSLVIESDFATTVGMVYVFLPYMILPIYTVLTKLDKNYIEGAADLGANRFKTFTKVVFPLSLTGVLSGVSLVLLPAATTIIIPYRLGDKSNILIGWKIEELVMKQSANPGVINFAAAMTIILSIVMLIIIVSLKKLDRFKGGELE